MVAKKMCSVRGPVIDQKYVCLINIRDHTHI